MTTNNSTYSNSLTPVNKTEVLNSTAQNLTKNSTNKILFCKSKALFFKKVYKALMKSNDKNSVARVQTKGRNLAEYMDKDCFVDSQIDEKQLYNIEFTVAIMELSPAN